jgi:hypothetical protein
MNSIVHCRRFANVALLLLLAACGPKIVEFNAAPRRVCAGDTVRMTFKTRGTPHLLAVRHGGAVADTTSYILVAEARGKRAYSPMDVVTFSPAARPVLAFDTDLLGQDSLMARDTLRAETWPDVVRLDEIFAESERPMVVRHGGKEAIVTPGEEGSPAWQGMPVSGGWEVHARLSPGEVPGDPAHPPPLHLYLKFSLTCAATGAQP